MIKNKLKVSAPIEDFLINILLVRPLIILYILLLAFFKFFKLGISIFKKFKILTTDFWGGT